MTPSLNEIEQSNQEVEELSYQLNQGILLQAPSSQFESGVTIEAPVVAIEAPVVTSSIEATYQVETILQAPSPSLVIPEPSVTH